MVAGNTNRVASQSYCDRQYWIARNTQLYWSLQNTWTYPTAKAYVERLWEEAPTAKGIVVGDSSRPLLLAVVTNVAKGGSSYHAAEELALSAGMDLLLMGKNLNKLRHIEAAIAAEGRKRIKEEQQRDEQNSATAATTSATTGSTTTIRLPKVYKIQYNDSHTLESIRETAEQVRHLVKDQYRGQIQLLIHNPSGVKVGYETTDDGIEINLASNFVAPHVLTEELLPLLRRQTATTTTLFTPRIIFVSSVGHCQGTDFDPERFLAMPHEGGAPEGTFVVEEEDTTSDNNDAKEKKKKGDYNAISTDGGTAEEEEDTTTTAATPAPPTKKLVYAEGTELDGPVIMYYRSKMALVANAKALAVEEPTICPVCVYPGSVESSHKTKSLGIAERIYQAGFSSFQLSPSQGARATLRAALDPDFNIHPANTNNSDLQGGAYLHCDGNPWTAAAPQVENPATPGQPYTLSDYAIKVRECTQKLCAKISHNNNMATVPKAAAAAAQEEQGKNNNDNNENEETETTGNMTSTATTAADDESLGVLVDDDDASLAVLADGDTPTSMEASASS